MSLLRAAGAGRAGLLASAALAALLSAPAQAGEEPAPTDSPPAAEPSPPASVPDPAPAVAAPQSPAAPAAPAPSDVPRAAFVPPPSPWVVRFTAEGTYRNRTTYLTNLADEELPPVEFDPVGRRSIIFPRITRTSSLVQRARLLPSVVVESRPDDDAPPKIAARALMQLDVLSDVLWGDNNARSSAPLFATNPTNSGMWGDLVPDLQIPRAWVEVKLPIGELRVGRMPSHWGLGILANGGGTFWLDPSAPPDRPRKNVDTYFDEDFGDKHFGSTNDRILFATKPIELATFGRVKSNLLVAYAFDKVSAAPLLADEPFDKEFRAFSEQGFLANGKDDVDEHVLIALYKDQGWHPGTDDERWGGVYVVLRNQDASCTNPSKVDREGTRKCDADTGSRVQIYDLYGKLRWGPWYAESEVLNIRGRTFGGVPSPPNSIQRADIWGAVGRVGWLSPRLDLVAEAGYASGDRDLYAQNDNDVFSQRPLHPDYGVGLVLYREILRERSARRLAAGAPAAAKASNPDGAKGFASLGGVVDSIYLNPRLRFRMAAPGGSLRLVAGVLMAWLDEFVLTGQPGAEFFPEDGRGKYLGTELDLGAHYEVYGEHVLLSLETGYLVFGDALKRDYASNGSFTLQTRVAFVF